ncbi:pyruvate dehydrogenase E2 component (dihydrolipoamide acetyltransferase)/2-oxoglutarate dehydrogenase E2 component (dihydrolipoamide succinyltransferase) [Roseivivax lentus]|uniref:Pyruvate dehydrogenase E2 component (Dihydrolipoamide acetyltransferase)/2-oxoglutarate dehydrogenase E2 component (Dihydrolipoamide succinyltransferase) n=1 Tax=Roseivivax lentus TaxID=633194 RepID=A0A1N7P283_9RHOB|nr:biotin/lipoyl-containing protein [Roseivivax lentus]SIT04681.1 pyruvate dehydrogenase E2 component (dihydrolipoamide acetyltransferase)/2-oxoglutarate dehydrogenase E2 component (dihydrolipoamide succinyltransferase) [Roseivivax lentus]
MPLEVIMPALGMAQDTGLIVSWHKEPGDKVAEGDVLFEVETDKATMEVEAQGAGFLSDVRAGAGDEVPVGNVIAVIADSAEEASSAPAPASEEKDAPAAAEPADDALPEGEAVIMPALGMAQDSGHIVAWHKGPGDAVKADDVLFEVETDKATMDVEAGHDGFVAALLAEAGEDAPVGEPIAIISAEKPANPVSRSRKAGAAPAPAPKAAPAEDAPKAEAKKSAPAKAAPTKPAKAAPTAEGGRILASPKARRLALEQVLDLNRLVAEGHPQPYHAADIEVLKGLPAEMAGPQGAAPGAAARHLTARIETEGFTEFAAWAAAETGLKDAAALMAGLAAASLDRGDVTVAVEQFGATRLYKVPDGPFGGITPADEDAAPDLILRDLRLRAVQSVTLGAEDAPVLTLLSQGAGLTIALECGAGQLSASAAVTLLTNFAGRMELPLRHLL